jgi:opacity protein-like surface antigen
MKKVLSVMAVSAFVLTAGVALAGGGKKMGPGCPEACQQQIDDLNSSQAQQNELLNAHGKQLKNHEGRITALEKAFDDYWYFRLGAGAAWLSADGDFFGTDFDTDFDAGWTGRVAFGREFAMYNAPGRFRAELEFGYQSNDAGDDAPAVLALDSLGIFTRDVSADIYTFMINGYYELPVADAFSIYAMAGVGLAHTSVDGQYSFGTGWADINDVVDGSNSFAYKAGIGVTYNFTNEIAADLGYEYLGISDIDGLSDIGSSNVVASVRFKF